MLTDGLSLQVTAKDVSNEYSVMAGHSSLLEDKMQGILVGHQDPRVKCVMHFLF